MDAFPSVTLFEFFWRIPYCVTGFLVVQSMRKAGVKGIDRPEENDKLWRQYQNTIRKTSTTI